MTALTQENRKALQRISTATITTLLLKRGLRNVFMQGVAPLRQYEGSLVGEAFTLRYIPAREDIDQLSVFLDPDHPQRKAIEVTPEGQVLVMDGRGDASAAIAGAILCTRLQMRGVAGLVSDGGLRDVREIRELDMPVFVARPSAPTNLIKHHAVDMNVPIGCGGVPVYPGDIILGDDDGVAVIPSDIANEIAQEAVEMTDYEDWATQQVRSGRPIRGLYPASDEARADFAAFKARS
jgi:regulator of RNase E activity RraA